MSVQKIIDSYASEITSLNDQSASLSIVVQPLQSKINQFLSPVSQLDLVVSNLTVNINQKIYDLSVVANAAYDCGCGATATRTVEEKDIFGNVIGVTTETYIIGDYYYYDQAKAHRINAENTSYSGVDPYGPYEGTDGSVTLTTGIGYATTVNGINSDSIISLTISNIGSGYTSGSYYKQALVGGSGNGGLADIVVGTGGSIASVIVNNGGYGYQTNNVLTISAFPGASFTVSSIGSPVLGNGVDTYVVSSSGIGSVFVPSVFVGNASICPTSCPTYANQVSVLTTQLTNLRTKRDSLLSGINVLKSESQSMYVQRYGFIFAQSDLESRKSTVNSIVNILSDSTYGSNFV
jgi:hypothetical protein